MLVELEGELPERRRLLLPLPFAEFGITSTEGSTSKPWMSYEWPTCPIVAVGCPITRASHKFADDFPTFKVASWGSSCSRSQ